MKNSTSPHFVLVEDDADDRSFFREALLNSGCPYELLEFENGESFLNYLKENVQSEEKSNFSWMVILDIHLPTIDGIKIMQVMREHPLWKRIPVITVTDSIDDDLERRVRELGAVDYLQKVGTMKRIIHQIKHVFGPCLEKHIASLN